MPDFQNLILPNAKKAEDGKEHSIFKCSRYVEFLFFLS